MSYSANSIPASFYANVTPGVIEAGPSGIVMSELMLTTNTRAPIGTVPSFPSLATVEAYFGAASLEATEAAVYFGGYNGATSSPNALLFAQYPLAPVSAYVRGGSVASMSLTQLQGINGAFDVTIDGTPHNITVNLSAATSFSNAAQIISTALGTDGPTQADVTGSFGAAFTATGSGTNLTVSSVTGYISAGDTITGTGVPANTTIVSQTSGTTGGAGVYVTSAATTASAAACTTTSFVLDVTTVASGTLAVGQEITGSGVTAGTYIVSQVSGTTGGIGLYTTTVAQHVASEAMVVVMATVTYDSVSGGFVVISGTTGATSSVAYPTGIVATDLLLTATAGAIQSPGAAAATPATFMTGILGVTQDFVSYQTIFDPDQGVGNTQKQAFAAWNNTQGNRFVYVCTDTDITPTESTDAASSMGQILKADNTSGTVLNWQPAGGNNHLSSFVGGFIASIDWNATNGRATADFKSQSGIVPSVTNELIASNLLANGYNYYGSAATAGGSWQFYDNGSISGEFEWLDTYIGQIWLNNQCQIALMNLLTGVGRIPYNPAGYAMIRQALTAGSVAPIQLPPQSPVAAGLNNGVITPNVPLSGTQIIEVNNLAGVNCATQLSQQGWYLVIQPATAAVRAARNSPTIILLYMDGDSVQRLNLSSYVVL